MPRTSQVTDSKSKIEKEFQNSISYVYCKRKQETANSKWHRKSDNYLSVGGYLGGHKISESVRQTPTVAAN